MRRAGNPSHFLLDGPDPDGGPGTCAPHVSIFMFAAVVADLPAVLRALREVAGAAAPVAAVGSEYAHNPHGAPELYFERSPAWFDLQRRVVAAFEPLRRGRQREVDPAGTSLARVLDEHGAAGAASRRQLLTYGYDEITDDTDDRFRPHITLAWPQRAEPAVELASLPAASTAHGMFDQLAVHGMSAWGACTAPYGAVPLTGPRGAPPLSRRSPRRNGNPGQAGEPGPPRRASYRRLMPPGRSPAPGREPRGSRPSPALTGSPPRCPA